MRSSLSDVLGKLRRHQPELRKRGVAHAAIFGSVARGESTNRSDVDILIELDPDRPMGIFEYAEIGLYLSDVLGEQVDLVNKKTIKPLLRANILGDAVAAF